MKSSIVGLFVAGGLLAGAGNVLASDALAKKHGCMACHTLDKKLVGPAFKLVAAKYAGDAGAEATLVTRVKNGGKGVWGQIPMPPSAKVPDADIQALVKWVLSAK